MQGCRGLEPITADAQYTPDRLPVQTITPTGSLVSPVNITCMLWHCGKEQEHRQWGQHANSTHKGPKWESNPFGYYVMLPATLTRRIPCFKTWAPESLDLIRVFLFRFSVRSCSYVPQGMCRLTGVTFCLLLQMIKHRCYCFYPLRMLKVDTNRTANLYLYRQETNLLFCRTVFPFVCVLVFTTRPVWGSWPTGWE